MRTKPITLQILLDARACAEQRDLFQSLFGQSVTPTRAIARRVAHTFNWEWAASHLLRTSAMKAYNEAVAPARKAYQEAAASALRAYVEPAASPHKMVRSKAAASAWKAYAEARAVAFLEAWRTQK